MRELYRVEANYILNDNRAAVNAVDHLNELDQDDLKYLFAFAPGVTSAEV